VWREREMRGENIVCLSWVTYDFVPLLMHHMMNRLKRRNRVLFVDPPFALATFLIHPSLRPNLATQWKNWREGVKQLDESMYLYTPPPLLMQYGTLALNDRLNRWWVENALAKVLRDTGFDDAILWVYAPFMVSPSPRLGCKLVIYGCHDEVSAFVNPERRKRGLRRLERDFIQRADIVFTTTKSLFDVRRGLHPRTYLFSPGVDTELFEQALSPDLTVPEDLSSIPSPRIGFTGNIDNLRMDWDLIMEISRGHPRWHQVLIGPHYDPIPDSMKRLGNVHFLGKKPLESLPAYIKGLDVCYMPYLQGEWSTHAFPTKTFEYLAGGKTVVTMHIPALEHLREVIYMVEGRREFIDALEMALAEGEEKIEARVKIARQNTWDSRVEKTISVIEQYAAQKGIPIKGIGITESS
jgi:glycosyltransferase involved in cell wall biosynthesis